MQSPYMPSRPAWLTNLLNGIAPRPLGSTDPKELEFYQEGNAPSARNSADALVQRILDEATSRQPPIGLFGPQESDLPQASDPRTFLLSYPRSNAQPAYGSQVPGGADALVARLLDHAANNRPSIGVLDPTVAEILQRPKALASYGSEATRPVSPWRDTLSRSDGGHLFAVTFSSPKRASEGSPMRQLSEPDRSVGDRMSTTEWMRRRNDQLRQQGLLAASAPAERGQNEPPATDTVDPLEYWSEYRAPAGRSASGGDQRALDLQAARAAGIENPGAVEIENPGAIFNDVDEAARRIHPLMNRVSRSQNMEYKWAYYRDKATGKIGYTDPIATGSTGGAGINVYPFSSGKRFDPNSVDVTGTGHTHGDYSRRDRRTGKVVRTMRMYDEGGSDDFSRTQRGSEGSDYESMRRMPQDWAHTLGTPSGRTWKWTHQRGRELLYDRDP